MKSPFEKVAESELQVLNALWTSGEPLPATRIVAAVSAVTPWESTTIKTLIHRLTRKGVLQTEKREVLYYSPLLSEAEFSEYQTGRLIDTFYSGKATNLVSALFHNKRLSDEDLAELRKLLDLGEAP